MALKNQICIFLSLVCLSQFSAQKNDTKATFQAVDSVAKKTDVKKVNSGARKATIMSLLLPGLGQVYNKKAWKVPIIYAGLGGFGYLFYHNQIQYAYYKKNLKYEYDDDSTTINVSNLSGPNLLTWKTTYRKRRDVGAIGFVIIYVLNIVDANVDAHLKTFDVSDDLSLNIEPWQNINLRPGAQSKYVTGISIKLNFK